MTKKLSFKYEILLGDPEPQHKEWIPLSILSTYIPYILLIFARFGRASSFLGVETENCSLFPVKYFAGIGHMGFIFSILTYRTQDWGNEWRE